MGIFLLGLVLGLFLGAGAYYWMVKKEVRSVIRQLDHLDDYMIYQAQLRQLSPSKPLGQLIQRLNALVSVYQKELLAVTGREGQLRQDLASISHDLRTPLTAMQGYLELLEDPETSPEDQARYLKILQERAQVLASLINNLFYLMRLEQGQVDSQVNNFSLSQVLSEQLAAFYPVAQEADLELALDLEEPLEVTSDPAAIRRIINNLLFNMIEHGQGQARIRSGGDEEGAVYLELANTFDPSGVDTTHLDQWWDRHFMGDPARSQHNAGLGLPIVKHLMDHLGHRLDYHIQGEWFVVRLTFEVS